MGKQKGASRPSLSNSAPSKTINGFQTLPISYTPDTTHYLYLRADKGKSASSSSTSLPPTRTLFVVNLPPDATSRHLRHLFEKAGRIEDVRIKKRGFGAASQEVEQVPDEEEDDDDDDEAMDDENANVDSLQQTASSATSAAKKSRKQLKREAANKPKIPELYALSPVNPRRDHTFLHTGSTAHVIFLEEGSVEKALSMAATKPGSFKYKDPWEEIKRRAGAEAGDDGQDDEDPTSRRRKPQTALEAQKEVILSQDPPPPTGLSYFLQSYNTHRPSLYMLKKHADSVVSRYTFFRSHPHLDPVNQQRASQGYGIGSQVGGITIASWGPEGEPLDADGFTIVLPGGKYGRSLTNSANAPNGNATNGSSANANTVGGHGKMARSSLLDQEAVRLKQEKKMQGLEDFYRFQNRERRKEKLVQMRKQFEEDREKVQRLKDQGGGGRRFKPY